MGEEVAALRGRMGETRAGSLEPEHPDTLTSMTTYIDIPGSGPDGERRLAGGCAGEAAANLEAEAIPTR